MSSTTLKQVITEASQPNAETHTPPQKKKNKVKCCINWSSEFISYSLTAVFEIETKFASNTMNTI